MLVKQISVFLENKKGKLAEVTKVLKENNVDLSAISIADTANFGVLRMIVNEPQETVKVLHNAGYTVNTTEVLAVEVADRPGGLHEVLDILNNHDISIEYLYSFVRRPSESALILFRVEEPEKAVEALKAEGINLLTQEDISNL